MQGQNTILEDISTIIGYSATTRLTGWFGGRWLRVPLRYSDEHLIARIIGPQAFSRLVTAMPGEFFFVPQDMQLPMMRRNRVVFDMLCKGERLKTISEAVRLSERQVYGIRRKLREAGLFPPSVKGDCAAG